MPASNILRQEQRNTDIRDRLAQKRHLSPKTRFSACKTKVFLSSYCGAYYILIISQGINHLEYNARYFTLYILEILKAWAVRLLITSDSFVGGSGL